jgi:alginate O-acetyltransferase complex protein AlgJ
MSNPSEISSTMPGKAQRRDLGATPAAPPASPVMKRANVVLVVLFAVLLTLPTLDAFLRIDLAHQPSENRSLARMPQSPSRWNQLQTYVSGLDAYFTDHFGFRKRLVQWHNDIRWSLFKDQNTRNVLVGKDGWLFLTWNQMIENYTGAARFTPEQLHDWQVLLEKRRDWLAQRGIAYLFVVTPDKQTIYPEYVPDWLNRARVRSDSKLDQFIAYMHEHSTVPVLDVRAVLRNARQEHPTFLKIDAHWNQFAGFVAYQELVRALSHQSPGIGEPLPFSSFTLTNKIHAGGDLARMIGMDLVEPNAYFLLPNSALPAFTTKMPPAEHPKDPKSTTNPAAKGRLAAYHDSFALNWIPFLGYHFGQVDYFWQYDINPGWIEHEKPDVVITEMNENVFNVEDPSKLLNKESLN